MSVDTSGTGLAVDNIRFIILFYTVLYYTVYQSLLCLASSII